MPQSTKLMIKRHTVELYIENTHQKMKNDWKEIYLTLNMCEE